MPMLNWLGKNEVIRHAHNIPYHVLKHKYNFGGESDNMIIHGDNLLALRSLLPEYECRVKCIYIDPPYNTGNENWVYNDNVNSAQIQRWLHQVVGKDDLSRHDKWLCMMYPRLSLLKMLLADDGAIFISIDENEQANLKLLCDEIFGSQNFINMFIWKRNSSAKTEKNKFTVNTEFIFMYAKSQFVLNDVFKPLSDATRNTYNRDDSDGRGRYATVSLQKPASPGPETTYDYVDNNGKIWQCPPKGWRMKYDKVKALENDGRLYLQGNTLRVKDYWNERVNEGKRIDTLWNDLPENTTASRELRNIFAVDKVFDSPKPVDLIARCISICPKDSIVLDSFAGSGTTAHAVLNLNAQDGGNRRFILVEMEDYAESITAERVKRVINGYGKVDGTGGNFNFYEVGESLVVDDELNDDIDIEIIRSYIWFSETRTRYVKPLSDNPAYLGTHNDTAYYFHHERGTITNLDDKFLRGVVEAAHYVVYADKCTLDESDLDNYNITFKKIPRDVR